MEWFFHVGHSFKEFISSLELSFKDIYSSMTLFCGCHILCAVASVSTLSNVLPPSSGEYDILEKTLNSQGKGYFFIFAIEKWHLKVAVWLHKWFFSQRFEPVAERKGPGLQKQTVILLWSLNFLLCYPCLQSWFKKIPKKTAKTIHIISIIIFLIQTPTE